MDPSEIHSKGTFDPHLFERNPSREIARLILVKWALGYSALGPERSQDRARDLILGYAAEDVRQVLNSAMAQSWSI